MDRRKGMSQTLALIVAASVLMMTALTVIFMTQGSLEDIFKGSNEQECLRSIEGACNARATVSLPGSCGEAGLTAPEAASRLGSGYNAEGQSTIICR